MPGKKWCEYCRINLTYNKKDIQEHEETRLHLRNKQKAIQFQRIKTQRAQKQQRQVSKQNALLSTANIPKAKKGSQLQKQVQQYRESVMANGKAAIHQLIAEKTQGLYGAPIQFPQKQDLVLAENYAKPKQDGSDGQSEEYQMWRIDICEETGEACFINNITKAKYYEPPKGHIMSQKQKQEWDYLKEICKEKVDVNADNTVNITEWQQVPDQQNYFKVNELKEENLDLQQIEQPSNKRFFDSSLNAYVKVDRRAETDAIVEVKKSWMEELQEKVNSNQIDANEVMETVIYNKLRLCKNIKEKNDTLKKLIKNDIQIRQTLQEGLKNDDILQQQQARVGFKPKKKVKTVKLTEEKDLW